MEILLKLQRLKLVNACIRLLHGFELKLRNLVMCGEPFPSVELACRREKRLRPDIEGLSIKFRPGSIVPLFVPVECTVVNTV